MFGSRSTILLLTLWGLGCGEEPTGSCQLGGEQLSVGESQEDPWLCIRCACEVNGLRCLDIEGCVNKAEAEAEAHLSSPSRDARAAGEVLDSGADQGGPPSSDAEADAARCEIDPSAAGSDEDKDTLTNAEEAALGTNPCAVDTDGDGQSDGAEVFAGLDPLNPSSKAPLYADWGEDGVLTLTTTWRPQLKQVDVTFLLDQTSSMAELLQGIAEEMSAIAAGIDALLPDPSFGLATFADYPFLDLGGEGDLPFYLRVPQTTSLVRLVDGLGALHARGGGDGDEASLEALHQALTGQGYDQSCDGIYDEGVDVPPRISSAGDAFGGRAASDAAPGVGKIGGMGYRFGALPIIVYGTDAPMRDPDLGHRAPGGCPFDAGMARVVEEATRLDARLIGVMLSPYGGAHQARALALATRSQDLTGAPLVYSWDQADPVGLRDLIIEAVASLAGGLSFEQVGVIAAAPEPPAEALIINHTTPERVGPLLAAELPEELIFEVHLEAPPRARVDQLFLLELRLVGDAAVELGQQRWLIRIPAR